MGLSIGINIEVDEQIKLWDGYATLEEEFNDFLRAKFPKGGFYGTVWEWENKLSCHHPDWKYNFDVRMLQRGREFYSHNAPNDTIYTFFMVYLAIFEYIMLKISIVYHDVVNMKVYWSG